MNAVTGFQCCLLSAVSNIYEDQPEGHELNHHSLMSPLGRDKSDFVKARSFE